MGARELQQEKALAVITARDFPPPARLPAPPWDAPRLWHAQGWADLPLPTTPTFPTHSSWKGRACPGGAKMWVGDCRVDTQIDAHIGKKEGMEAGCPPRGLPGAHWGKALRMAFTSSATAVRANSNWSLERTRPGRWSRTCSRVAAMSISFTPLAMRFSTMSMRT